MEDKPVFLVVAFQIESVTNGGIESLNQFLMNMNRYRAVVVTNAENDRTIAWRAAGIPTYAVAMQPLSRHPLRRLLKLVLAGVRVCWTLLLLLCRYRTRLIFANDPVAMRLVYPLALAKVAKVALCLRGVPNPELPPSARKYRAFFKVSRHLFFLSRDMGKVWLSLASSDTPPSVTYVAVPDALFRLAWRPDSRRNTILICGRLSSLKAQLEFLLNCGPALMAANMRIVLAGDDHYLERAYGDQCRAAAEELGEGVQMVGHTTDLNTLYATATVLVMPSRVEGLGRARAEAMAAGCPVVSFDVCSSEELLGKGAGVIVPQGDWQALTRAIITTVENPRLLQQLSANGRRRAEELFRVERVVGCYEGGITQMTQSRVAGQQG